VPKFGAQLSNVMNELCANIDAVL